MGAPLDELYLHWLYAQIANPNLQTKSRTYWSLARQMYVTKFVWFVPNDDNRVEDGRDLRFEFVKEVDPDVPLYVLNEWMMLDCSMLELMIGLSRRLAYEAGRRPRGWFWRLVENLELEEFTDRNYNHEVERQVDEALAQVVWRTYHPSGRGGLFPLEHPRYDQTEVELWYQLCAYVLEHQ